MTTLRDLLVLGEQLGTTVLCHPVDVPPLLLLLLLLRDLTLQKASS